MAITTKDAIKAFEAAETKWREEGNANAVDKTGPKPCVAADEVRVRLSPISLQMPLILKMDGNSLGTLKACKDLRMGSNAISKIEGLQMMSSLETLMLGRNQIKSLSGIDQVAETLQQLWISYNLLSGLSGIEKCTQLTHLFASNNKIGAMAEVDRCQALPKLRDLNLFGNPVMTAAAEGWRIEVIKRLPNLKNIDGAMVEDDEREQAKE